MGQAAYTINLPEGKRGFFLRMPTWFGSKGKKITPVARAFAARVFGVSEQNADKGLCTSYDQIGAELGVCRRSVASSVGSLKKANMITENNRTKDGTSYIFTGKTGQRYDIIPLYLYTADFKVDGIERRLTKAQVLLLGHFMTQAKRPKNAGVVEGSMAQFAQKLNLSETTIKKGIKVLLKAGLIYRAKNEKGVNSSVLSRYHVNRSLYDYEKLRRVRAPKKSASDKILEAVDARAEREAYYARRQDEMKDRAERYLLDAYRKAPRLKEIDIAINKMQPALARASLAVGDLYKQLKAQERALKIERAAIYNNIGADERKIHPGYYARCRKCNDSGYHSNGKGCTCYLGEDV